MTTQTDLSRVIDKVKKCLALSASSNEHEAAAALRQAQKLMAMHNLDQTTVELGAITEGEVRSVATAMKLKAWENHLAHVVKEAFGIEILWRGQHTTYGSYIFIGPAADVAVATHTMVVLQRLCAKARKQFLDNLPSYYAAGVRTGQADSYALGWVNGAAKQVEKFARPEAQRALIKARAAEISGGKMANTQKRGVDQHAARAGLSDGKGVTLRHGVNAGPSQKMLGASA